MKLLKYLSQLIFCIGLFGAILFNSSIRDSYYRNEVGSNVVRLFNVERSSGGTGFHIKTEKGIVYILTNKHVCGLANEDGTIIVEKNGENYPRQVVKKYDAHDLCLVEAINQDHDYIDIASSVDVGEDITVVGHPALRNLTISHGEFIGMTTIHLAKLVDDPKDCKFKIVEDFLTLLFTGKLVCMEPFYSGSISAIIYGGNSGSPVINKFGNVVGVVFAGNREQVNDSYMVPLRHVKAFLKGL